MKKPSDRADGQHERGAQGADLYTESSDRAERTVSSAAGGFGMLLQRAERTGCERESKAAASWMPFE